MGLPLTLPHACKHVWVGLVEIAHLPEDGSHLGLEVATV
jgi:hypothetical protein